MPAAVHALVAVQAVALAAGQAAVHLAVLAPVLSGDQEQHLEQQLCLHEVKEVISSC